MSDQSLIIANGHERLVRVDGPGATLFLSVGKAVAGRLVARIGDLLDNINIVFVVTYIQCSMFLV